jgi:hypothetical protein
MTSLRICSQRCGASASEEQLKHGAGEDVDDLSACTADGRAVGWIVQPRLVVEVSATRAHEAPE